MLQLFNKLLIICNSECILWNLWPFSSTQISLHSKTVIFTKQFENGSTLKTLEMLSRTNPVTFSLKCFRPAYFILLNRDILYACISWYSMGSLWYKHECILCFLKINSNFFFFFSFWFNPSQSWGHAPLPSPHSGQRLLLKMK